MAGGLGRAPVHQRARGDHRAVPHRRADDPLRPRRLLRLHRRPVCADRALRRLPHDPPRRAAGASAASTRRCCRRPRRSRSRWRRRWRSSGRARRRDAHDGASLFAALGEDCGRRMRRTHDGRRRRTRCSTSGSARSAPRRGIAAARRSTRNPRPLAPDSGSEARDRRARRLGGARRSPDARAGHPARPVPAQHVPRRRPTPSFEMRAGPSVFDRETGIRGYRRRRKHREPSPASRSGAALLFGAGAIIGHPWWTDRPRRSRVPAAAPDRRVPLRRPPGSDSATRR